MRELEIILGIEDMFNVVSREIKNGKVIKEKKHIVDLRHNFCQCDGFKYAHKCWHIRGIIDILKSKGIAVFFNNKTGCYYTNWDFQDVEKELKNEKIILKG